MSAVDYYNLDQSDPTLLLIETHKPTMVPEIAVSMVPEEGMTQMQHLNRFELPQEALPVVLRESQINNAISSSQLKIAQGPRFNDQYDATHYNSKKDGETIPFISEVDAQSPKHNRQG